MNWTVIGVLLIIAAIIAGVFGAGQMAGSDGHFDIAIGQGAATRAEGDKALAESQANQIDTRTQIEKDKAAQDLANQQLIAAGTTDSDIQAQIAWNKTVKSVETGFLVLVWLACLSIGFFLVIKFGYIQPRRAIYVAKNQPISVENHQFSTVTFPALGISLAARNDEQGHTLVVSRSGVDQLEIDPHVAIEANYAKQLPATSQGLAAGSRASGGIGNLALTTLRGLLDRRDTNAGALTDGRSEEEQ